VGRSFPCARERDERYADQDALHAMLTLLSSSAEITRYLGVNATPYPRATNNATEPCSST
jgi:hypothetical protein